MREGPFPPSVLPSWIRVLKEGFCSQLGGPGVKGPGTAERQGRHRDLEAGIESTTVLDLLHNAHKDICWLTVSTEVEQTIDSQKGREQGSHPGYSPSFVCEQGYLRSFDLYMESSCAHKLPFAPPDTLSTVL